MKKATLLFTSLFLLCLANVQAQATTYIGQEIIYIKLQEKGKKACANELRKTKAIYFFKICDAMYIHELGKHRMAELTKTQYNNHRGYAIKQKLFFKKHQEKLLKNDPNFRLMILVENEGKYYSYEVHAKKEH